MKLETLIAECTAYDFKLILEEKKPDNTEDVRLAKMEKIISDKDFLELLKAKSNDEDGEE